MILRIPGYHGWWTWEGKEKKPVCTRICCAGALYTLMLALLIHTLYNKVMNVQLLSKALNNQSSLLIQLFASCFSCWKSYIFFFRTGGKVLYNEFQVLPHKGPEKHCYEVLRLGGVLVGGREGNVSHITPFAPCCTTGLRLSCPSLCKCKRATPTQTLKRKLGSGVFGTILP